MTARLIDAMCSYRRRWTVENRMWRDHVLCRDGCRNVTGVILLPHLDSKRQLAIHEAGHAVAFQALGEEVLYATIDTGNRNGPPGGVQTVSTNVDGRGVLAGAAAVHRWASPSCDADLVDIASGARTDFQNVWRAGVSDDDAAWLLRQADELVGEHWSAIERVADALVKAVRLSGEEIAAIVQLPCNA